MVDLNILPKIQIIPIVNTKATLNSKARGADVYNLQSLTAHIMFVKYATNTITLHYYHHFDFPHQDGPSNNDQAHMATNSTQADPRWYLNKAAMHHLTSDFNNLTLRAEDYAGSDKIHVGNGASLPIHHIGASNILSSSKPLLLENLLDVPYRKRLTLNKFIQDNNVFFESHPNFFVWRISIWEPPPLRVNQGCTLYSPFSIIPSI